LILLTFGLSAQVTVTPSNITSTISESGEHVFTLTLNNTGSNPVNVWWQINKPANFPSAWKAFFCDDNFCYTPAVEFTPATKPNTIAAKSTVKWTFHIDPSNVTGSSKVQVQFFSDATRRTLIAETDKDAVVTADKSLNTKNPSKTIDVKISPNPVDDYFTLQNDLSVSKIAIYNIVGKQVESFKHQSGNVYNISEYPRGIYIIRMFDNRGKILKSPRLAKR
jgi:hypothetical protein